MLWIVWLGGAVASVMDLKLEIAGSIPNRSTVEYDLRQVVHNFTHSDISLCLCMSPGSIIWYHNYAGR